MDNIAVAHMLRPASQLDDFLATRLAKGETVLLEGAQGQLQAVQV